MNDKEFLEELAKVEENDDCPEVLVKMAVTKWQKQVAVEFVLMDKKITVESARREAEMHFIKKITLAIFTVTVLAFLAQLVPQFL